jgi:AAA+ ATPase superfamily predicted ATPase
MKKGYIIIGSRGSGKTTLAKHLLKNKRFLHVGGPRNTTVELIAHQTSFVPAEFIPFNFLLIDDIADVNILTNLAFSIPDKFLVDVKGEFLPFLASPKLVLCCGVSFKKLKAIPQYKNLKSKFHIIDTDSLSVQSIIQFIQEKR